VREGDIGGVLHAIAPIISVASTISRHPPHPLDEQGFSPLRGGE
jgi:hypothetical protein